MFITCSNPSESSRFPTGGAPSGVEAARSLSSMLDNIFRTPCVARSDRKARRSLWTGDVDITFPCTDVSAMRRRNVALAWRKKHAKWLDTILCTFDESTIVAKWCYHPSQGTDETTSYVCVRNATNLHVFGNSRVFAIPIRFPLGVGTTDRSSAQAGPRGLRL